MEFFSWAFLATTGGSIAATVLVTKFASDLTGASPKWVAMMVAVLIQVLVWAVQGGDMQALALAVLNSFVVYGGAVGTNSIWTAGRPAQKMRIVGENGKPGSERWW